MTEEKNKSENRIRFNLLDALLLLLAVLCIVGVWQRENLQRLFRSGEMLETYAVSFEIKKYRLTEAKLLVEGNKFYFDAEGEQLQLGTLSENAALSPSRAHVQNKDGNTVEVVYPQEGPHAVTDVNGKLRCRGVLKEGTFMVEGKAPLAINQTISVSTEMAEFVIHITDISLVG